jgi:hypothetical protein
MRPLLFFTESPFTKRDYERFGIEQLSANFDVRVVDCTPWVHPKVWKKFDGARHTFDGYRLVRGPEDFNAVMLEGAGAIAIDFMGAGSEAATIRLRLQNDKVPITAIQSGLLPPAYRETSFAGAARGFLRRHSGIRSMVNRMRGVAASGPQSCADLVIVGGTSGLQRDEVKNASHRIAGHCFDYDIYLALRNRPCPPTRPYAVFLDEDFVYHSDFDVAGVKPPLSESEYYPTLNRFFRDFENATGLEVVFSAHPRSNYAARPNLLDGRPFVLGGTAELVQCATIVLTHVSTAQSFAVLWGKPLAFLTSNELRACRYGPMIDARARLFNKAAINMSAKVEFDMARLLEIDAEKYRAYTDAYLKMPGSPELSTWDILNNYLVEKGI